MDRVSVAAGVAALYGDEVDWPAAPGRIHVAAIQASSGRVLAIGPASPPSPTDRFVLGFARARAEVIVTTGSILRAEPDLVHTYGATDAETEGFAAWRRAVLGWDGPPRLLVLSATGSFPLDHPALRHAEGWIWTTEAGRARIGTVPTGFECVVPEAGVPGGDDAEAALRCVRDRAGCRSFAIEAGPSTTAGLYAAGAVDELLLSRFEGAIADAARGPAFVAEEAIVKRFGTAASEAVVDEASGRWRFERWRAGPGGAAIR